MVEVDTDSKFRVIDLNMPQKKGGFQLRYFACIYVVVFTLVGIFVIKTCGFFDRQQLATPYFGPLSERRLTKGNWKKLRHTNDDNSDLIKRLKSCYPHWKDVDLKPFAEPQEIYAPVCKSKFLSYKSSKLEQYMIDNVKEFQGVVGEHTVEAQKRYCHFINGEYVKNAVSEFIDAMARYRKLTSFKGVKVDTDIFSTMTYHTICKDGTSQFLTQYIEPLIGLTRHPYAICKPGQSQLTDSSYLLFKTFGDDLFYKKENETRQMQSIGMDLGASYWGRATGPLYGTSTAFLYDKYENLGSPFNRLIMYEGQKYKDREVIWNFPKRLASIFQYFNTWANLNPNDDDFSLRILNKIARKEDFVMLKVDIDQPKEINVVLAMLESRNARAAIDEFFFEHHTKTPLMAPYWRNGDEACQVSDTYDIFLALRNSGIRSHGWP